MTDGTDRLSQKSVQSLPSPRKASFSLRNKGTEDDWCPAPQISLDSLFLRTSEQFHLLHHRLAAIELDSDLEVGEVAVDVERNGLVLLGLVVELEADVGA